MEKTNQDSLQITLEEAKSRIIVALDCSAEDALALADKLQGRATWLKVGMTLFYAAGPSIVSAFKDRGFKVFVDLKLHDIPHQVKGAAKAVCQSGADMFTVHACGGEQMMKAAVEGATEACQGAEMPIILAVTVLTSMDDETLLTVGVKSKAKDQVENLAKLANASEVTGVVASPQEAAMLAGILDNMLIVTPGVRPKGSDAGDQSRIATPRKAFEQGSTHVVIGRPITQAEDPVAAFDAIAKEIAGE